jgi:2'-5' RNA ligase
LKKTRAFLSLNLEEPLKIKIAEIQKELQELLNGYKIKWENPEKFHLTLRFLGDLDENQLDEIKEGLEKSHPGFGRLEFHSDGIGFFPNPRRPNVIFIALGENGNNSDKLVEEIDKVIKKSGIKPDKKFVAHITLGRFRRENRKSVDADNIVEFESFDVNFDSYYLMESVLDYRGSKYYEIKKFNFNT